MNNVLESLLELMDSVDSMKLANLNFTEIDKLAEELDKRGICYTSCNVLGGKQIIVFSEEGERLWDAVLHCGSYGHNSGLIEIMGTIVRNEYDDVEGYLTADEILSRI